MTSTGINAGLRNGTREAARADGRRFRPYPEYREAALRLLNHVPAHWDFEKLKFLAMVQFSSVDKKTFDGELPVRLCNYVDVYYNEHITKDVDFMLATATGQEIARFALRLGDVLVTKDSEEWDDIAVPSCVRAELHDVICGYHLAHIRPDTRKMHGEYLSRAFAAHGIRDQFRAAATGITRYGLAKDSITGALFPVPPLDEQRAIAGFLDRETGRIDELIAKKERLIELLAEKRTALISHVVTKGLNPAAPMKDSGIPWLGEVPKQWSTSRTKHVTSLIVDGVHETPEYVDHGIPFVTVKNLTAGEGISFDDLKYITPEDHRAFTKRARPERGDILITKDGTLGICRVIETDTVFSIFVSVALVKPRRSIIDSWYLRFAFESRCVAEQFAIRKLGSGLKHLHLEEIAGVFVPLPPIAEQRAIVAELSARLHEISLLATVLVKQIAQLREYRSALISAAVTGKIDVREESAG